MIGTVATAPTAAVPAQYKNGDPTAGKQVFLTAGCTGCHTLKDAGSTGTVGPNLDDAKPPLSLAVTARDEGRRRDAVRSRASWPTSRSPM